MSTEDSKTTAQITCYSNENPISKGSLSGYICINAHGGGGTTYTRKHPLVQLALSEGCSDVYSIQLPYHGRHPKNSKNVTIFQPSSIQSNSSSSSSSSPLLLPVSEVLFQLRTLLDPIIKGKKVFFTGFSMGGICLLNLWDHFATLCESYFGVFVGVALKTGKTAEMIKGFWTEDSFKKKGTFDQMKALHGDQILQTIRFVHEITSLQDSALYFHTEEAQKKLASHENLFFVSGDQDQPYPPGSCILPFFTKQQIARRIRVVPNVDHFSCFTAGWRYIKPHIQCIMQLQKEYSNTKIDSKL